MRLEFKVLWFENQMDQMTAAVTALDRELKKQGFRLELDHQQDASRLEELAVHQERFHDFDLVVVDFDLGAGQPTGDEVAQRIRTSFGFTDIIFYSGTATETLREKVKEHGIDGVYCCQRPLVREKLLEHVGFVVERLSRLEAMRGLAVVGAGRGDEHMRDIIRQAHALADDHDKAAIISEIDKHVDGFMGYSKAQYKKVTDLETRLSSRAVTSKVLFEASKSAIAAVALVHGKCAAEAKVLDNYLEDIIEPRNKLGHIVETREPEGWVIKAKAGTNFGKPELVKFRKNLRTHLDNFASLKAKLGNDVEKAA